MLANLCFAKYQSNGQLTENQGRLALIALTGDINSQYKSFLTQNDYINYSQTLQFMKPQLIQKPLSLVQFVDKFKDYNLTEDELVSIFEYFSIDGFISNEFVDRVLQQ
ncbi:hypothetical protein SS50377_20138 [Spironucleus salmonicida]|uniref:Uncharacterized protein n=1 Tax=Spironucleus salmonicida TaxID=348837 RepID=A0A9P8LZH4_9EUKA|nr:hypothetical protein SS50377_20138 [Spironucleus salmonicida]